MAKRQADLYIFCLLKTKEQSELDPMDLDKWAFYVFPTQVIDKERPTQKTITLNSLLKLNPTECGFDGLKTTVSQIEI